MFSLICKKSTVSMELAAFVESLAKLESVRSKLKTKIFFYYFKNCFYFLIVIPFIK
jgi:hypothetical protein